MLKKRIIPCLDIDKGRTVKGVNFRTLKDMGDPTELAKYYVTQGADELVFLDISATLENRTTLLNLVKKIAEQIDIPFTVGGGISSLHQVEDLLSAGADKISINSAAIKNPNLINEIAKSFGSQFVVVAVDTKCIKNKATVFSQGGRSLTDLDTSSWCQEIAQRGAGEILLTSIDADGTRKGFDINTIQKISSLVNIPVIASGGAGNKEHFSTLFHFTESTGALAASIFHDQLLSIPLLKQFLNKQNIPIRCQ